MLEMAMPAIAGHLENYGFMYGWGHSASSGFLGGPRAPVLVVSIELDSAASFGEAKDRVWGAVRDMYYQVAAPGDDRDSAHWVHTWEARVESLLARWESLAGRNKMYSDFQQYEPTGSLPALVQALRAATPGSARAVAEKYINQSNARYVLVEPSGTSAVGGGGAFSGIVEQHGAPVDRALADKPLPKPPKQLRVAAERYVQDNGLAVVLWPNGATPLVNGRLVIDAGASDDPFGREGAANLVGASDVYPDSLVFERRDLSIRVDELLVAISSELRSPGYGLSDEARKYMVARLEQERVKERAAYTADKLVALYGEGHPYARNEISAEGVKHLSQDSVEAWAREQIVPKNATLILTGTFDPVLVKKHIAYSYAHVAAGTRTRDVSTAPRTTPLFIVGETTKPSPTVEIDVHFVGGRGIDRDHAKRLVLEAVLDAQLSELRQKRALTYGFYASYAPRRAGGLWTISGEADASRAAEAGGAIIEILDGMRRDPESYRGAFVLARQKVLEALLVGSTSSAEVAERLVTLAQFGLDDDFYDDVASDVADMTLTELHTFLVRELAVTGQVFGAFGNLREARAATNAARAVKPGVAHDTIVDPFAD